MPTKYLIDSARFSFGDRTLYPTRAAAMKVIREYVKEEVRPRYKQVRRVYRASFGWDGYEWVYWDASKPAGLYVEEVEHEHPEILDTTDFEAS